MRRETIRALEVRKNSIMAERHKSAMQTLGANNEYAVNPNVVVNNNLGLPVRNTRTSNAGISVKDVFDPNGGPAAASSLATVANASQIYGVTGGGQTNLSYEDEDGGGIAMHMSPRGSQQQQQQQVSWGNSGGNVGSGRM